VGCTIYTGVDHGGPLGPLHEPVYILDTFSKAQLLGPVDHWPRFAWPLGPRGPPLGVFSLGMFAPAKTQIVTGGAEGGFEGGFGGGG
jgi:hypothetical protein